ENVRVWSDGCRVRGVTRHAAPPELSRPEPASVSPESSGTPARGDEAWASLRRDNRASPVPVLPDAARSEGSPVGSRQSWEGPPSTPAHRRAVSPINATSPGPARREEEPTPFLHLDELKVLNYKRRLMPSRMARCRFPCLPARAKGLRPCSEKRSGIVPNRRIPT